MLTRAFLGLLLLALVSFPGRSEVFEAAGFSYEMAATSSDPDVKLPMVVALHFMGGSPETSREDYANIKKPARILLLAGPYKIEGGYSWFPDGYYEMEADAQARVTLETADRLSVFLSKVTQQYNTDGLPIITGYSQGADLAHVLAIHHGNQIGAIVPMGARFESEWYVGVEKETVFPREVILFHGETDTTVPITYSQSAQKFYQDKGVNVSLEAFPNTAHAYPLTMKQKYEEIIDRLLP
jgi:predicted esterase